MIQKAKGTRDFFGQEAVLRYNLITFFVDFAQKLGFVPLDTPIFESTELFKRSVGSTSDIVQKELFYLDSDSKKAYALRPELTAGVVRALIEKGIKSMPKPINVYTVGSVYRYEKPQKGRYREFIQFDLNSFRDQEPLFDAFLIASAYRLLTESIGCELKVYLNSLGSVQTKQKYSQSLLEKLSKNKDILCKDCQARLVRNPLRILDCKAGCKDKVGAIKPISDFLTKEEKHYFNEVTSFLDDTGVKYELDPTLMRGLDYYTSIIFEIALESDKSRSSVICGGGRFDNLVSSLGGPTVGAIGLGIGLDRLAEKITTKNKPPQKDFFISPISKTYLKISYKLAINLSKSKSISIANSYNLQDSLNYALKNNFKNIIIVGEETKDNMVVIKNLINNTQKKVKIDSLK